MKRTSPLIAALLASLGAIAWAQDDPTRTVRTLAGPPFEATLESIDTNRATFHAGGRRQEIAMDELFMWGSAADVHRGGYLLLADGGMVAGEVKAISRDEVHIESTKLPGLWQPSPVPRAIARAVVFQSSANPQVRDRFDFRLLVAENDDRLYLAGGDVLSGTLLESVPNDEAAEPAGMRLRFLPSGSKQPIEVPFDRLVAIGLGRSRSPSTPKHDGAVPFWIGLADGSCVLADGIDALDDVISIRLAGGGTLAARAVDDDVEPPESFWSRVVFVQPLGPRISYLSDLRTIGFKHLPLLGWPRDYATDRSVAGSRLRAGGQRSLKGVGMPATSRLAFDVPAGAKRFEAEIALDDAAERGGSAIFRVYLEAAGAWKTAFESQIIRGGDAPQSVRVELAAAKRLALVVDMADHGDLRDWADWLSARFIE